MEKKILIYSPIAGGHFCEYIYHLYEMAIDHNKCSYVFILPKSFEVYNNRIKWVQCSNITVDYFDDNEVKNTHGILKLYLASYKECKLLNRYIVKYNADTVFTTQLISLVPFAPICIRKGVKTTGIIYRIYLYDKQYRPHLQLLLDKVKYLVLSKFSIYHRVLLLNGDKSAPILNKMHNTEKFVCIPDPYLPLKHDVEESIRKQYSIPSDKSLFVQFGALNTNKGTLEVIKSIKALSEREKHQYAFIFAGKIMDDIHDEFYSILSQIDESVQIIVKDEYCTYEYFGSLCMECDAILTPYHRVAQSSGLIGYASQFGKPVIAPNKGLLGELVMTYNLGITIDNIDTDNLITAYKKIKTGDFQKPSDDYCKSHTIQMFQNTIYNCL